MARNKGGRRAEPVSKQSYAQVTRSDIVHTASGAPQNPLSAPSPRQQQRIALAREIRRKTQEIKAAIRCDERSFQFKPATLKGQRPSFRQLGISLERKLRLPNFKAFVEDIRSDRGGRYYIQIRENKRQEFESALDRTPDLDHDKWDIELADLGTFEVSNPYQSISTGKIPVVIGNVDDDIPVDDLLVNIAEQNASRWQLPAAELLDSHIVAPHRLNRRKRDATGTLTQDWIPCQNVRVFVSKTLHEKLFGANATPYATLDYMVLPVRAYHSPNRLHTSTLT